MVLTEAFAAGRPANASAIAGDCDVGRPTASTARPRASGDPQPAGQRSWSASIEPSAWRRWARRRARALAAARGRRIVDRVTEVDERAIEAWSRDRSRARRALGRTAAGRWGPAPPPWLLLSLICRRPSRGSRRRRVARRARLGADRGAGRRTDRAGSEKIGSTTCSPAWVRSDAHLGVVARGLMAPIFFRAASWYGIVRAALPNRPVRRRDVTSATMSGRRCRRLFCSARRAGRATTWPAMGRTAADLPVLLGTLSPRPCSTSSRWRCSGRSSSRAATSSTPAPEKLSVLSFAPLALLILFWSGRC